MKDKINKELEDLGWESMQSLLDKEMPDKAAFFNPNVIARHEATEGVIESEKQGRSNRKNWLGLLLLLLFAGCGVASYPFFKAYLGITEATVTPIAQVENTIKTPLKEGVLIEKKTTKIVSKTSEIDDKIAVFKQNKISFENEINPQKTIQNIDNQEIILKSKIKLMQQKRI